MQLLYRPALLIERVAAALRRRRRLRKLRGTVAAKLQRGHIDSLELLELLRPLKPAIIYDIGANVGTWTLLAKAIFPDAEVHAFEPLSRHCVGFSAAATSVPNVTLHPVALGARTDSREMQIANFSDASSLLEPTEFGKSHSEMLPRGSEHVSIVCLDDYATGSVLPLPDLIKLDVQGFELEVLRGAAMCLRNATAIVTEVSFAEYYYRQALFHDVVKFLADNRFQLAALGHGTALGERLTQTDALFIKRDSIGAMAS